MKHLIKGGFVVSDGIDITKPADVLIEGDKIKSVGYSLDVKVDKITEAAGLYVYPGFIDMHCTVCEPGHESVEDMETASVSAARGGFTTIVCIPDTEPAVDNKTVVEYIIFKSKHLSLRKHDNRMQGRKSVRNGRNDKSWSGRNSRRRFNC